MSPICRLDLLRGNNGNGDLFQISVIHGYSESTTNPRDDGRLNFNQFNRFLDSQGYQKTTKYLGTTRPLYLYTKSIQLASGRTLRVEVRHLLVESEADSRNVSFAKYFKDSIENSDVIVYGGHSGLGANLDIPSLEAKAGKFKFNSHKRQLLFFDSCASYSYLSSHISAEKTRAKIDVISNGLASLFIFSEDVLEGFFNSLVDPKATDVKWEELLRRMQKSFNGYSYLLNVGSV